jgi:hypothetical protein
VVDAISVPAVWGQEWFRLVGENALLVPPQADEVEIRTQDLPGVDGSILVALGWVSLCRGYDARMTCDGSLGSSVAICVPCPPGYLEGGHLRPTVDRYLPLQSPWKAAVAKRHRTLLSQLVAESPDSQQEIVKAWNRLAGSMREDVTLSTRQFARWLVHDVRTRPATAACRVSERFWRRTMDELLGPPAESLTAPAITDNHVGDVTDIGTLVMTTAHESGDHAASVARYVDPNSIDNLADEITAAARAYAGASPAGSFTRLLRARDMSYDLLDRTKQPDQEKRLYLLASQATALLASATFDLGYPQEAVTQARVAHTYGRLIGDPSAQGYALAIQCTLAFWAGQPTRGLDYAEEGLRICPQGTVAVRLHSVAARCWGLRGDLQQAREHLTAARNARGGPNDDICDGVGGEFGFSPARTAFSAGATYIALGDGPAAAAEASQALTLYAQASPQDRWIGGEFGARADLVTAHVLANSLDQAERDAAPLLELPSDYRSEPLVLRARNLQHELADRRFRGNAEAARLSSELEGFIYDSARRALPGPGAA